MVLTIVEENRTDIIVVHSLQAGKVRLVRVAVHSRRTVGVDHTAAEADAFRSSPYDIFPGATFFQAATMPSLHLVGQEGDGLFPPSWSGR